MDSAVAVTDTDLAALVTALTADEKVALVVGATAWTTTPIERIGLRSIHFSDGPVGVRGSGTSTEATSAMMPAPSALAATWDIRLAARVGELFASEARRHDVHVVLAPQVNLQRTPVGGRHFECYSEDPHLTAEIAVAVVRAAQHHGVGMCAKHFVANESETERTSYRSRVDERTLREVYLAPFERLVTEALVWTVMGAYNGVDDGTTAAPMLEHRPLLTGVLKHEWGFDGPVVSDWVATRSIGPAVRGGLDLQMPGPDGPWGDDLAAAVARGDVVEAQLDDKVLRLLRLARRVGALGRAAGNPSDAPTSEQRTALLRELSARAVVVLQDAGGLVPLEPARLAEGETSAAGGDRRPGGDPSAPARGRVVVRRPRPGDDARCRAARRPATGHRDHDRQRGTRRPPAAAARRCHARQRSRHGSERDPPRAARRRRKRAANVDRPRVGRLGDRPRRCRGPARRGRHPPRPAR